MIDEHSGGAFTTFEFEPLESEKNSDFHLHEVVFGICGSILGTLPFHMPMQKA